MPVGYKILARPIKKLVFHNVCLEQTNKYPNLYFIRNCEPSFAIGQLDKKVEPPAMMVIRRFTVQRGSLPSHDLIRIEILPPKRKLEKIENLPALVVFAYESRGTNMTGWRYWTRTLIGIEGKYKKILHIGKSTSTGLNSTDIVFLLAWSDLKLRYHYYKYWRNQARAQPEIIDEEYEEVIKIDG